MTSLENLYNSMWILGLKGLIARENNGTESKMPSLGLGAVLFFRQVNHLKLVRSCVLGRSTNVYSVLSRENKWTLCTLGRSITIVPRGGTQDFK